LEGFHFLTASFARFQKIGVFKGKQNLVCVQNQQPTQTQTVTATKTNKRNIRRAEKQLHPSLGNNRLVPC
jgi:hypothetical protein